MKEDQDKSSTKQQENQQFPRSRTGVRKEQEVSRTTTTNIETTTAFQ